MATHRGTAGREELPGLADADAAAGDAPELALKANRIKTNSKPRVKTTRHRRGRAVVSPVGEGAHVGDDDGALRRVTNSNSSHKPNRQPTRAVFVRPRATLRKLPVRAARAPALAPGAAVAVVVDARVVASSREDRVPNVATTGGNHGDPDVTPRASIVLIQAHVPADAAPAQDRPTAPESGLWAATGGPAPSLGRSAMTSCG